jgi:formate-dependent phosphoribosylglycinamide formyltransferase (GAR transformylase)
MTPPIDSLPRTLLLLGSGELGKEVAIAAQRLGCRVIAVDRYAGAPAMQVANIQELSAENLDPDSEGEDLVVAPKTVVKEANDWSTTPRNAPCPCGSGKKYKMCHGRN